MSRRDHGSSSSSGKPVNSEELLRQEAAVYLSAAAENQLARIAQKRENVELALQRMDVEIYDLESEFLKQCVSYGGSLFDGFGLERQSSAHRNPVAVLTPLHSSAYGGVGMAALGNFESGSPSAAAPGSPLLVRTGTGEQMRAYRFLSNNAMAADSGTADSAADSTSPALYQVGSKGASSPAFHYRIHFFSPSERVFSACSVGALSRVDIAKSTADMPGATAKAASSGGRGQGAGKRGRQAIGNGSATAAFAREPDAPPSRRRNRESAEDDNGGDNSGRRRRHTE